MNLSTNERVQGWCLMLLVAAVLQLVAYTEEFAFFITLFFFHYCYLVVLFYYLVFGMLVIILYQILFLNIHNALND